MSTVTTNDVTIILNEWLCQCDSNAIVLLYLCFDLLDEIDERVMVMFLIVVIGGIVVCSLWCLEGGVKCCWRDVGLNFPYRDSNPGILREGQVC